MSRCRAELLYLPEELDATPHARHWDNRIGVVRALTQVRIRLLEEDEWYSGGDDDTSQVVTVDLPPFDSELTSSAPHTIHWGFNDGEYHFNFRVGKWRE